VASFKLRVIEPCIQPWKHMTGGDRERFCERCALTVHNLSAMTEEDARRLIAVSNGRLCVRYFGRRDGRVINRRGGGWIGRAARVFGLALLAIAFWASVVMVQRPWQALARRIAGVPPRVPAPPQVEVKAAPTPVFDLSDPPSELGIWPDRRGFAPLYLYETTGLASPTDIALIVEEVQKSAATDKKHRR
jgi:hypothetical protein